MFPAAIKSVFRNRLLVNEIGGKYDEKKMVKTIINMMMNMVVIRMVNVAYFTAIVYIWLATYYLLDLVRGTVGIAYFE